MDRRPLFALHRYWIWADWMRILFDSAISKPLAEREDQLHVDLYLSYWYAALYVAVEGWRALALDDEAVGVLIASSNTNLLRRYRNAVFHFQADYWDDRRLAFMAAGHDTVPWVRQLHSEMGRALLAAVQTIGPLHSSE